MADYSLVDSQGATEAANTRIHAHATPNREHRGMGTTVTIAGMLVTGMPRFVAAARSMRSCVMFMDDTSTYQIAPGGIFAGTFTFNCANPFLSDQQRGRVNATAASGGGTCLENPNGLVTGTVARRNIEGGGRQGTTQHTQYRYVIGLKGDLGDNWNYDAFMQYGRVSFGQVQTGFFRTAAINNALNVVSVNGTPTHTTDRVRTRARSSGSIVPRAAGRAASASTGALSLYQRPRENARSPVLPARKSALPTDSAGLRPPPGHL